MGRIVFLFVMIFFHLSLNAAIYKGQKVFVKECIGCHKNALVFLSSKDAKTWEALMDKKGENLAKEHLKDTGAEKSWKYFDSDKYTKKSKHLKQFLMEYSKDSGKVPALN